MVGLGSDVAQGCLVLASNGRVCSGWLPMAVGCWLVRFYGLAVNGDLQWSVVRWKDVVDGGLLVAKVVCSGRSSEKVGVQVATSSWTR